ncbi:MAG TPA: FadD3 family acyl-CoA ligase [Frankiaceae bacterium]|nr:FadD3 family acyl-CoA ligase [Frankiaceae bacterium]
MQLAELPYTIPAAMDRATNEFADRQAVVDGERQVSYRQLGADVRRAAGALLAAGVERGDRVAVWAPNSYEWIVIAFGIGTIGAILVPVNTRFRGEEAADVIRRTRAKVLLVSNGFLGNDYVSMVRAGAGSGDGSRPVPGLAQLSTIIDLGSAGAWDRFLATANAIDTNAVDEAAAAVTPEDVLDIIFTSGTTGRPKGAMSTHRQTIDVAYAWSERALVTSADRYLVVNPFFHTFGYKAGFLVCMLNGATVVPMSVFDVDAVLDAVAQKRISILPGPPTLYYSLLENPRRESRDLSSLRLAVTGTTVVPVPLIERMRLELSFSAVVTAYGLSEAVVATMCHPGDPPQLISHSSGVAVAGFEVRVVDRAGIAVAPGTSGEILLRGRNVMTGYFEDAEATAEAVDGDGWLHTGDIGHLDEGGYLTITDRLKDMFTVGGFNVYPAEVEQVIMRSGDVLECAVVARPDERLGEVGVAYVVARAEHSVDAAATMTFCREKLANYKVPREVRVVSELPRNAAGKVLKTTLRAQALVSDT